MDGPPKISHNTPGLLTHKQFDVKPAFGITTRSDRTVLDPTNTVFGKLLPDALSADFLKRVSELPMYSIDRPAPVLGKEKTAADYAAEAVFSAQRDLFRGAAKSLGDTRVGKLYEGKLLRRVEVTQVGVM